MLTRDQEIVIYNCTENSYCRTSVSNRTWMQMIRYLDQQEYSKLDIIKILYSKMVRWSEGYARDPMRITLEAFKLSIQRNNSAMNEILTSEIDEYFDDFIDRVYEVELLSWKADEKKK